MSAVSEQFVDIRDLRIGMYVELDMGWLSHPFSTGSFVITSEKQIGLIRELGLQRVRVNFEKSKVDTAISADAVPRTSSKQTVSDTAAPVGSESDQRLGVPKSGQERLQQQQLDQQQCQRRFDEAIRGYLRTTDLIDVNPGAALRQCQEIVTGMLAEMSGCETAIRLLGEGVGDKLAMHPVNVTVISLLLGKALGMSATELADLGVAAFLHDVGKQELPERVRFYEDNFSSAEYKLYQNHVLQSVSRGKMMSMSSTALQAIAQHHEVMDGSGFPARVGSPGLSIHAKVLALVNCYDNLCNPARLVAALTPHEALAMIFAQMQTRFDTDILNALIRMLGVYPPGSIVQLVDGRVGMVVSVNSVRPLKPRVLVHDAKVALEDALVLDLELESTLGIRRSMKAAGLSRDVVEYLSPRRRICYFFERVIDPNAGAVTP